MTRRAHISLKTKLAAVLLTRERERLLDVLRDEEATELYEHAKLMTAEQFISLYQFDHNILHAIEVNDEFWNIAPTLIAPHRRKSAKDNGIVAKVDRLTEAQEDFRRRALARPCGQERQTQSRWPKRKFSR